MDIVDQHRYRYYALDTRSCTEDFEGGYLSVAAYVYPHNTIYNGTWGLLVNTGGNLPSAINSSGSDDGDDDNDDGSTLTDIVGMYLLLCTSLHIWHLSAKILASSEPSILSLWHWLQTVGIHFNPHIWFKQRCRYLCAKTLASSEPSRISLALNMDWWNSL